MISLENNNPEFEKKTLSFEMEGFGIVELNSKRESNIFFYKGIPYSLLHQILNLYQDKIIEKKQGYINDVIGKFNIYIHFFNKKNEEIITIVYVNYKDNPIDYKRLYHLSKSLYARICSNTSIQDTIKICEKLIKIPVVDGLLAIFIVDEAGFLYFSKINENEKKIEENKVQIAGFISAILCFSQDYIGGKEAGFQLKSINVGRAHFLIKVEREVIFVYFADKQKITDRMKRYMLLIPKVFLDKYYEKDIKDFNGVLTPFYKFKEVVNQYFII